MGRRLAVGLLVAVTCAGSAGCGSMVPLPVPATPTAVVSSLAPRREPPADRVVEAEQAAGVCSHADLGQLAAFHGHYNAANGAHYHGWQPPKGEVFWVVC